VVEADLGPVRYLAAVLGQAALHAVLPASAVVVSRSSSASGLEAVARGLKIALRNTSPM